MSLADVVFDVSCSVTPDTQPSKTIMHDVSGQTTSKSTAAGPTEHSALLDTQLLSVSLEDKAGGAGAEDEEVHSLRPSVAVFYRGYLVLAVLAGVNTSSTMMFDALGNTPARAMTDVGLEVGTWGDLNSIGGWISAVVMLCLAGDQIGHCHRPWLCAILLALSADDVAACGDI